MANSYTYDWLNPVKINGDFLLGGQSLDERYARVNTAGTTSYLTDALGSALALTNSSAATTASYSYEPYGKATKTGSDDTPLQFTGRENDGASNLYYYRARYYSPQLGRFISQDPIGFAGGINGYTYARGNPISNIDPLGLWSITGGGYVGAGGELTVGFDNGHFFLTSRVGFGIGGGISVDPNGGIPGGTEATGSCGGAVISASVKADAGFGPFGAGYEGGVFRNFGSQIIDTFSEKGGSGDWDFGGLHGGISGGVQVTLYTGTH